MKLTKEEALAKIKELEAFIKQEDEVILVPDCIEITKSGWKYSMWIWNWKQELFYNKDTSTFWIIAEPASDIIKCKLVKVEAKDKEIGKIYYRSDDWLNNIENIVGYSIYLWDDKYVYWSKSFWINCCSVSDMSRKSRYEVVNV